MGLGAGARVFEVGDQVVEEQISRKVASLPG